MGIVRNIVHKFNFIYHRLYTNREAKTRLVVTHSVSYQREVDKDKLTAVASFEMLTFRA